VAALERREKKIDERAQAEMAEELRQRYDRETDIRYAAARLWIDAIIDPAETRDVLSLALDTAVRQRQLDPITTGVFQV
jgi:acetyl-CoA carboxylase carboxyltransferase component